ncbi:hypothetical protein KKH27_06210 [bacterium]|nr:hypothetical protein [bacterium]MBU1985070.1 hypothetical protein [bacterium]
MQKLQLHLLLLILLVAGCASSERDAQNPSLSGKSKLSLIIADTSRASLQLGPARLDVPPGSVAALRLQQGDIPAPWRLHWWTNELPLYRESQRVTRSLISLIVADTAAGTTEQAVLLPGGRGLAYAVFGRSLDTLSISIACDSLALRTIPLHKHRSRTWTADLGSSRYLAVAVSGRNPQGKFVEQGEATPAGWRFTTAPGKRRQIVLAFAGSADSAAALAEEYVRLKPEKIEKRTLAALNKRVAFQLHTQDERANQVHALLAAALTDATPSAVPEERLLIESDARLAAGCFLASRSRPAIVFPPDPQDVTPQQKQDVLRWGSGAFRAALAYGMAEEDTLKQISLDVLSGLTSLQADYVTADLEVLATPGIADSLLRLSLAHIRLAGVMGLGSDVALARGDRNSQGIFQGEAGRAARKGRGLFQRAILQQREQEILLEQAELLGIFDPVAEELILLEQKMERPAYDDTLLLLQIGADYGFNWIADNPLPLWKADRHTDGFLWQRWTDFRFRTDLKMLEIPDLDSLTTLLLEGSIPGLLTESPALDGAVSPCVMAASFQNLAELYVGVRPGALRDRVDIEPRLPSRWGRTSARVPFKRGYVTVTYAIADDYAVVGMDGIDHELDVFFAYPLAEGGYLRTQFKLAPGKHPQRITKKRESDGRLRLLVEEVP